MKQGIFTSESVSVGHPDKVADQISDAILDECLRLDPEAHVAVETAVGARSIMNLGEVTCKGFHTLILKDIARRVIKDIGYDDSREGFAFNLFDHYDFVHGQSPDIAQGVKKRALFEQGAGDQGMMFGYATNETKEKMPLPLVLSNRLMRTFERARRQDRGFKFLRPDAKSQVSVVYDNGRPVALGTVVISHQTTEEGASEEHYQKIADLARSVVSKTELDVSKMQIFVNPTGRFVRGGPCADSGLTGRKIIVDTYGGMAPHGGGAFSGKDPSKVDRSAAYYARYAAKNIVAAGLAERCQIQVAYAIGVDKPVSICVDTFGTAHGITDEEIASFLTKGKTFDFRPGVIAYDLNLRKPDGWSYLDTAATGHFGDARYPWEREDKVEEIQECWN